MFHKCNHNSLFIKKQLKEIKETLRLIRRGGENTGVIYSVKNDQPNFIHMTFAEYFAVEYICDLQKKETHTQRMVDGFIFDTIFICSPINVLNILDTKIKMDEKILKIFNENDENIFNILLEQSKGYTVEFDPGSDIFSDVKKFASAFNRVVCENLLNFIEFFCRIHTKYLTQKNIDTFIDFVHDTNLTTAA